MTETLKNLLNRVAADIHAVTIGFAILQGYLEGSDIAVQSDGNGTSQSVLFIGNTPNKEKIKRMLINLGLKGSVRRRADGLLELRVWLEGKRCSFYGKTEEELIKKFKFDLNRRKRQRGLVPQVVIEKPAKPNDRSCTVMLHAWLDKWAVTYKEENVAVRSYSAILSCIKVHIKPNFADCCLSELAPLTIEESLKKIASSRMRKYSYQILNEAFKKALQLRFIKENPFALVDVPRHKVQKGEPLTRAEQVEFKSALEGSKYKYYFLFLLYSGCRRSEGLAARWEDVDFERKRFFVRGTKTTLSKSEIPLFDNLAAVLREILPENGASGLIFSFTEHQVEMAFKKICPRHHIHDLRHTFATNCLEAGVDLKAVQSWLRHSNIGITADTYAHATSKFLMREAEKVNKNDD